MLTIFTTPKPINGIERREISFCNAVYSWQHLTPPPEIIVFGGQQAIVEGLGAKWIQATPSSSAGLPYIDGMFALAQSMAQHDLLMYANEDIVFLPDAMAAIRSAAARFDSFLMVGRRWDLDVPYRIRFDTMGWAWRMHARISRHAKLHSPSGKDYFIFRRPLQVEIPPLFVGRPAWDNYLMLSAIHNNIPVIDASAAITAVHQSHDYSHNPGGVHSKVTQNDEYLHNLHAERLYNKEIYGRSKRRSQRLISDATWVMSHSAEITEKARSGNVDDRYNSPSVEQEI